MPKLGLDDYLLTHSLEEFSNLPTLDLDDPIFEDLEKQYKAWKNPPEGVEYIGHRRLTDIGNGERLALRQRDNNGHYLIHYSMDAGWRYWDDTHWKIDQTSEITRRAVKAVRLIYEEAAKIQDDEKRKATFQWALKSESASRVNSMIEMCKAVPNISLEPGAWDKDPWLLNLKNGTLDLQTGRLYSHKRDDLITRLININYDPGTKCPKWHEFLDRIIPNADDRRFLQKAVGYSLTGSIREECFFILYGTGQNGKSKFLDTIKALLGDYAGEIRTEQLMSKKFESTGANPDIASLKGLRFVTASETEANRRLAISLIKQMTGGGKMRARFLYQNDFSFTPTHKLWLEVNFKPSIPDTDEGIWRRIRMIPFSVHIPEDERDKKLLDKLLTELPGILSWALDGLRIWLVEELGWSKNIKTATEEFREESDLLKDFLEEGYEVTGQSSDSVAKSVLRDHYEIWSKNHGEKPISPYFFRLHLKNRGIREDRTMNARIWIGIKPIENPKGENSETRP